MNRVILSPEYFPNPTVGKPISNADIYVGDIDTDPEVVINQKQISVQQEDGSIVNVSQPISTGAGGVPLYNGSPVTILVDGDYSLKVNDSLGSQIYYVPKIADFLIDSDQITYNQGGTGAVDRTVEAKLQDYINVKDFGATGDGVTDDTTAIDNARTAAKVLSKTVYFPAGTYKYVNVLEVDTKEKFTGESFESTIWSFEPAAPITAAIVPEDDTDFTDFVSFQDLSLHGDDTNVGHLIWMKSMRVCTFIRCEFNKYTDTGVYIYGQRTALGVLDPGDATYNYFEQCRFLGGVDAVRLGGTAGAPDRIDSGTSNMNVFVRCRFASASRYGLWMEKGASNTFIGNSVVANGDDGVRVGWYSNNWTSLVAENNGGWGVRFDTEDESHNNTLTGLHDGGANVSGLITDQSGDNNYWAFRRGIHFSQNSGGTGSVQDMNLFGKTDGHLHFQDGDSAQRRITNNMGALVRRTTTQSIGDNSSTLVNFESEDYDDDGFWAVGSPSKLVVPADGVDRVRVTAQIEFDTNGTGYRELIIKKNGAEIVGGGKARVFAVSAGPQQVLCITAAVDVSPADYFQVYALQTSGGALNITGSVNTWFNIEVII